MFLVLIVHADFFSLGAPSIYNIESEPAKSFLRFFIESLALVCVNVFIIISGYFGIKTKTKSVLNFLFMLLFWRVAIYLLAIVKDWFSIGSFTLSVVSWHYFIPFDNDWFSAAYLLLFFFAPILNAFIEKTSTRNLRILTLSYIAFQWVFSVTFSIYNFSNGYSTLSFIGLYLIGATIKRGLPSKLENITNITWFGLYILCGIVSTLIVILYAKTVGQEAYKGNFIFRNFSSYNGVWVVLMSVALFLGFSKIKLQSKFINKIASSAFAVYLCHMNPMIRSKFGEICHSIYSDNSGFTYWYKIAIWLIAVFIVSILIDRIRILIWQFLNRPQKQRLQV